VRSIGLIALSMTAALILSNPAAAAWKEYPYPQLGFVVEFPADPTSSTGNYKTGLVASATAHIYSLKEDHALYIATAIDLLDRKEEGATLLGEAESTLTQLGDVISMSTSRVEPGKAAIYGRFITIDCRSGRVPQGIGQTTESVRAWFKSVTGGVECQDRSRLVVNMFFNRGRLYLIQGINLPSTEDAPAGPAALRFSNSISFFAADGSRNFADTFR
jgi:hypothetical protein